MFLSKAGFIPLALWYEIKFHSPDLHILQLIDVNWTLKWLHVILCNSTCFFNFFTIENFSFYIKKSNCMFPCKIKENTTCALRVVEIDLVAVWLWQFLQILKTCMTSIPNFTWLHAITFINHNIQYQTWLQVYTLDWYGISSHFPPIF